MRIRHFLTLWALLLVTFFVPSVASADPGPWSAPVKLSVGAAGMKDWFPAVAADNSGNVHVVWNSFTANDQTGDQVGMLKYTRWNGSSWTQPNDIALIWAGDALRSALAIDLFGNLQLIYKGFSNQAKNLPADLSLVTGQERLWYTSADGLHAESVRAWQPTQPVSRLTDGYYSDVAIDSQGTVHIVWTESSGGTWGIYYSHSTDGGTTWSPRVPLDQSNPVWWYRAHITVDRQDRVHVVWEVLDATGSYENVVAAIYSISTDHGETWAQTRFTTNPPAGQQSSRVTPGPRQPSIGVDGSGIIEFVYRNPFDNKIYYRTSKNGVDWAQPIALPGIKSGVARPYDIYSMATDSAGHIHLVFVAYLTGSDTMSLLHAEWDGSQWGQPSAIAGSPPYPDFPRIAVGDGNRLHVVWHVDDAPLPPTVPIGIWYSTALTSAPTIQQPPLSRVTSQPVSIVPTPTSSAASLVAVAPKDPVPVAASTNLGQSSFSLGLENQPDYPIVVSLVAVVLVLIIAVTVGRVARGLRR